jgi:hypothetical protein
MRDLVKALIFISILLSPCIIATFCASERRWRRRSKDLCPAIDRRDPR